MSLADNILGVDYSKYACNVYVNEMALSADFQVISIQIQQAYQHITSAQILIKQDVGFGESLFSNPSQKLPLSGELISVKADLDGDSIVLFEGIIVKHKYKNSSNGTRLQLTAKNNIVNMAITTQAEVFSLQSDKEVIETIASKYGASLTTTKNITTQLAGKHTQLVKHEISDWDFINVRAEANACFVYTEKDVVYIDKPTPEFDPAKIITANFGANVYELELEQDDRKNQVAHELINFDLAELKADITADDSIIFSETKTAAKGKHSAINYRIFNEQESTQLLAEFNQIKILSAINGVVHIHANLMAKPGATLTIAGYSDVVDKSYIITSVLHDYSDGGFSTYLQFGLNHQSFACKYQLNTKNKNPLIVSGIVAQLQDDPDNLYRLSVTIPSWKDAQNPIWARLSTMYAGDQYGMVFLPEIGDEVVVAFVGNDMDAPIVLGSAFSPKLPPHTAFTDDNFDKVVITRSGMKWSWNDDKVAHEISTPKGNKILISEDTKSITVLDQNQNKIEMSDSAISIEGSKDINIKATGNIKMEGINIESSASGINKLKGSLIQIN